MQVVDELGRHIVGQEEAKKVRPVLHACVCERERICVRVCERERELVCVCVCVRLCTIPHVHAGIQAVAIALRSRWRRQQLPDAMKRECQPHNILLVGPTGEHVLFVCERECQ